MYLYADGNAGFRRMAWGLYSNIEGPIFWMIIQNNFVRFVLKIIKNMFRSTVKLTALTRGKFQQGKNEFILFAILV